MCTGERGARGAAAEPEVVGECTAHSSHCSDDGKVVTVPKPAPKIHTPNPLGVGLEPGTPLVPLRARASLFPSHPQPGSANPQTLAGTGWRLDPKSSRLVVTRRVTSAWAPERRFWGVGRGSGAGWRAAAGALPASALRRARGQPGNPAPPKQINRIGLCQCKNYLIIGTGRWCRAADLFNI